jgi:hypothetical protein
MFSAPRRFLPTLPFAHSAAANFGGGRHTCSPNWLSADAGATTLPFRPAVAETEGFSEATNRKARKLVGNFPDWLFHLP